MDKFFLLIYTAVGYDGYRHSCHAWFETEEELRAFATGDNAKKTELETELAIEILSHRDIEL